MRSGSRHRGEAGGGGFGFPPLLATDGRIHKGDCDMRTGAIFARGSCRALKWMALLGVVFALGAGSAAAQAITSAANDDIMVTLPNGGALMEGQVATVTVAVPVRISSDLTEGDRAFTLGLGIADRASNDDGIGTGYGDVTQRELNDVAFSPSDGNTLTFTLPARDFSGEGNAENYTATASFFLVASHDLDAEDEGLGAALFRRRSREVPWGFFDQHGKSYLTRRRRRGEGRGVGGGGGSVTGGGSPPA